MLVSDMQKKDIINEKNGTRLGKIIDIDITDEGYINHFVVGDTKFTKRFSANEYKITMKNIVTVGNDVILVEIS